jgi:hypothetical protein
LEWLPIGCPSQRREFVTALAMLLPDLPMVGYEVGDDIVDAERLGFDVLGPLRVWIDRSPSAPAIKDGPR